MSDARPLVSVIVPAFNEAAGIEPCLRALLNQDYPRDRYRILVVDNASSDATAERVARYPVTRLHEPIRGIARARNAGIRAAQGECIAFTDADCVPCTGWLSALVEGWEDPFIGCFAGEITGQSSSRWVPRYVEDRKLISQRLLLSSMLPVAATGSIAFRRSVFESVGGFDETFRYGEDADLTWRLQKWGGFGIRYNPRALVAHAHPESLPALLRRTRHEGLGLAAFRLRHADDIRRPQLSRAHYRTAIILSVLGLARLPLLMAAERRKSGRLCNVLAFPLTDKLCSLALMSGIAAGLPRSRPPAVSPARRDASDPSLPCAARDVQDRLVFTLARDPLFRVPHETMSRHVRQDLETFCDRILAALPDASVLLTGSLAVGEGRWRTTPDGDVCSSDGDLVVVSRVPPVAGLRSLRRQFEAHLPRHPAAVDVDLAYVWQPFLERGWITTGGRLIAGDASRVRWLPGLPAPRASSPLVRAFLALAGAPLAPDRLSEKISKALVLGAQAYLLHRCRSQPRREWIGLLSLPVLRKRIGEHADTLGREAVEGIARAVAGLSGEPADPWTQSDLAPALDILRRIKACVPAPEGWRQELYRILGAWQGSGATGRAARRYPRPLDSLEALAACWSEGPLPDLQRLRAIARPAADLAALTPVEGYRRVHGDLAARVEFYPHKLLWRRSQEGRG